MMLLAITSVDGRKRSIPLATDQTCVIGRGSLATVCVKDPHMSRMHCQLEWMGRRCVLTDLQSRGGTFVNNVRIRRHILMPGEVVIAGQTQFSLEEDDLAATVTYQPATKPTVVQSLHELVGSVIHHYLVESMLVEDRDNAVFLGRHLKSQRQIALKVLWPNPDEDDVRRRRFIRSVMSLRGIRHPNLVRLEVAGRRGTMCWFVMEYVSGENLRQMIDRLGAAGMLEWQLAFRVALDIGRALTAAESAGVVHRNITPRSILRRNDGVYKLTGLTLAKARRNETSELITKRGELAGELSYLAPELVMNEGQGDHRSDLYGLGATVYRLLTGRTPYVSRTLAGLFKEMAAGEPPRPKAFQLSVSDAMEGVVLKLIAQLPEARYQSAQALVRDLERVGKFAGLSTKPSE